MLLHPTLMVEADLVALQRNRILLLDLVAVVSHASTNPFLVVTVPNPEELLTFRLRSSSLNLITATVVDSTNPRQ